MYVSLKSRVELLHEKFDNLTKPGVKRIHHTDSSMMYKSIY